MVRGRKAKAEAAVKAAESKMAAIRYTPPAGMALELKRHFRQQAIAEDRRPKPYTHEEILALYAEDVLASEGRGWVSDYVYAPGWTSGKELLDSWIEDSKRKLEALAELPEERWHEVYDREDRTM